MTALRNIVCWLHYQLVGPPRRPSACEYRRPARITVIRHGQRHRRVA